MQQGPPVLTTALIAGDQVILHILNKAGLLKEVKVLFIDTFHLFDETYEFLKKVEQVYGFKAIGKLKIYFPCHPLCPCGCPGLLYHDCKHDLSFHGAVLVPRLHLSAQIHQERSVRFSNLSDQLSDCEG